MKLSDYVVKFIKQNTDAIFMLSGGGIMHLVDSFSNSSLDCYCCHHEQAAAIAAEGYSRIHTDKIGVCLVTTGPGGTNTVTGIAGAWLDSIPVLVLAGQVKRADITPRRNGIPVVRQLGFQELNVIDIVRPITKYAVTIEDEKTIRYHLEKALYLAKTSRPGPVFIEIPLDVQAAEIEPESLDSFLPSVTGTKQKWDDAAFFEIVSLLRSAKRPLLMAGNGIRLAGGQEVLYKLLKKSRINVVTPIFTADDLVTYDYPHYLGRQGMVGNKAANYAVDNCDVLLVIGERLQLMQASWNYERFAPQAKKIMVDIDEEEIKKKTIKIDIGVNCDAKVFLNKLCEVDINLHHWDVKSESISPDDYCNDKTYLNLYRFFEKLNLLCHGQDIDVVTSNGMASLSSHQALRLATGQRFITNAGLGHMGSGLPLAIGAAAASGRTVLCMEGDGSLMLNIHDLQTIIHHDLPVKIFIFNNNGYYSIRSTHLKFFNRISASDPSSGVSLPDFSKLIPAWGLNYVRISGDGELSKLENVIRCRGPLVCELIIDPRQPLLERWTAGAFSEKNFYVE